MVGGVDEPRAKNRSCPLLLAGSSCAFRALVNRLEAVEKEGPCVARILIVDDEAQFRRVLRIALATRGHDVREAASGADALAILHADPAQLVLLDWQMPGLDGLQTCHAIRAWSNVPIIMVTSRDQNGRDQALAAGACDYVSKPFELDRLISSVDRALSS